MSELPSILVVDDDPLLLQIALMSFSAKGIGVTTACDGAEAWALLQANRYDVALVDIEIPSINGFDLIELFRQRYRQSDMEIIVITGRKDLRSMERAEALRVNSYITKPIDWRLLPFKIQRILDQRPRHPATPPFRAFS